MRIASRGGLILAATLMTSVVATPALADNDACYASYESAQQLRNGGDLVAAQRELKVCADPACPAAVTTDCGPWLAAVEASVPTVSFVVKDEKGGDLEAVTVKMDGKALVTRLDGKAVAVNPGVHTFTFTAEGRNADEKKITVHEGEKARTVDVTLAAIGSSVEPRSGGTGTKRKNLAAPFGVLAGLGVAGLGMWGVFGGLGLAAKSDAEETCAPSCSDDVVSDIETKFLVADISLGVGAASLVGAAIVGAVWATSSTECDPATDKDCKPASEASVRVRGAGVAPLPGGGAAAVLYGAF